MGRLGQLARVDRQGPLEMWGRRDIRVIRVIRALQVIRDPRARLVDRVFLERP